MHPAGLGVHLRPDGRDQALPVLGVELATDLRHAVRVRTHVQPPSFVAAVLVLCRPLGIGGDPPGLGHAAELAEGHRPRGLDQRGLGARERVGCRLPRGGQHLHGRPGDLALAERMRDRRHRHERTGAADGCLRRSRGEPLAVGEPPGRRQVAVGGIGLPALELGKASSTLGFEDASGSLDLVEMAGVLVRERAEILGSELVECGPERAHGRDDSEHVFDRLWSRSHSRKKICVTGRPGEPPGRHSAGPDRARPPRPLS
jgi:hypothetical protein